jgi:hypothetical protein
MARKNIFNFLRKFNSWQNLKFFYAYSMRYTYCKNKIAGISRSVVEASPAYYIMKIQSFSLLTNNSIERYESGKFEAGGHKWYTFRCSC